MKTLFLFALTLFLTFSTHGQTVTTLATGLGVDGDGIFVAPSGDLYVSGGVTGGGPASVVLRITPDGTVSTFASVFNPVGIYMDSSGDLYVNSYRSNTLNRISADGGVSALATGLNGPAGVVVNSQDEVLVTEFGANFSGNATTVRRVLADGTVETFATGGGIQGSVGIAVDENDVVYVANWSTGQIYRTDGETTTLFAEIGARVNQIAYGGGYLYVPSPSLRKIFRIDRDGTVEHIAGTGASGTADGPALEATFGRPNSIAVGTDGRTLYVIDADAQSVRVIHPAPGVATERETPQTSFALHPNYPNPVQNETRIRFTLNEPTHVRVVVSDALGRDVAVVADGFLGAGMHEEVLNASLLAPGIYPYRLESAGRVQRRLLVVAR